MSLYFMSETLPAEPKAIYIAGPMRGYDGFNFPAFFEAEETSRKVWPDAEIFNPAREDISTFDLRRMLAEDPTGLAAGRWLVENFQPGDLRYALGEDLEFICKKCELLIALPGWEASKGASAEVATARALSIPVVFVADDAHIEYHGGEDPAVGVWKDTIDVWKKMFGPGTPVFKHSDFAKQAEVKADGEVRVVSETGGEKGSKLAAFDQMSPEIERLVAEHFGKGARKYSAHNFRKGYPWSLSYSALRRHLAAFWGGEEYDDHLPDCPEGCTDHTGSLHIVAVIWHAMVLAEFFLHHPQFDDRYKYERTDT